MVDSSRTRSVLGLRSGKTDSPAFELLSLSLLSGGARHSAFTDLVRYRGRWLCAFREGSSHMLCRGKVRVLSSDDGAVWETAALVSLRGYDLRDPKFARAPGGGIDLVMGAALVVDGKPAGRHSVVARSADGVSWAPPVRIADEGDWVWRVERYRGTSYGITYRLPAKRRWTVHLLASADGLDWRELADLAVPGLPNEATIRFSGNRAIALVRRESGNGFAWIGESRPPYRKWSWKETSERVGGPNFILLPDGRPIAATRIWRDGKPSVAICAMTKSSLTPLLELPSGGDCGYPGMVFFRNRLWVSYYSSHEGKAKIYLAKVRIPVTRGRTPSR